MRRQRADDRQRPGRQFGRGSAPSAHAGGGGPCSAAQHRPPPCSPRNRHEAGRRRAVTGAGTSRWTTTVRRPGTPAPAHGAPEVVGPTEPVRRREHGAVTGSVMSGADRSGREALTTLATTRGEDRPPGAGAHPKAEAVLLVPATVVRLERPLAHWNDSGTCLETMSDKIDRRQGLPLEPRSAPSRNRVLSERSTKRPAQYRPIHGTGPRCRRVKPAASAGTTRHPSVRTSVDWRRLTASCGSQPDTPRVSPKCDLKPVDDGLMGVAPPC